MKIITDIQFTRNDNKVSVTLKEVADTWDIEGGSKGYATKPGKGETIEVTIPAGIIEDGEGLSREINAAVYAALANNSEIIEREFISVQ